MTPRMAIASIALAACALPAAGDLPQPVLERLRAANIPEDAMATVVQRLSDGATILAHQPARPMQPASTIKLLTSLAALERLGPAYRGRTGLFASGDLVGGVLKGDLILRGGGDVDFDWHEFGRLLTLAQLRGIREIRGDFVIDRSLFNPPRTDAGTPAFDETPEFRYNVIPDALLLNTNLLQIDLSSTDKRLRFAVAPVLQGVTVVSELKLVERECADWEDGWQTPAASDVGMGTIVIRLLGEFPRDCVASTSVNVVDRLAFADRLFRVLWAKQGVRFRGQVREGQAPADARPIAEHVSRALTDVVRDINKHSDNPVTRVVYLTMGASSATDPAAATARLAEEQVRAWLAEKGIDAAGLVLDNGSGLSRQERIRPDTLAAVLRAGRSGAWAPEFVSSLPIVAVDGGMRRRLKDSPAAGRARIKTGTLRDVSAIAGYVPDQRGETYIVVAMINDPAADRRIARPILDELIDWVARRGAAEAAVAPPKAD